MKIIDQETTELRKSKNFTIELAPKIKINIYKYVAYNNFEDDTNWEYQTPTDHEKAVKWLEKQEDEDILQDFINDLKMWD